MNNFVPSPELFVFRLNSRFFRVPHALVIGRWIYCSIAAMRLSLIYRHKRNRLPNTVRVRNACKTPCRLQEQRRRTLRAILWGNVCCKFVAKKTETNFLSVCSSLVSDPTTSLDCKDCQYIRYVPSPTSPTRFLNRCNNRRLTITSLIYTC